MSLFGRFLLLLVITLASHNVEAHSSSKAPGPPPTHAPTTTTEGPRPDEPYVGWVPLMEDELYLAMFQKQQSGIFMIVLVTFGVQAVIFGIVLFVVNKVAKCRQDVYYRKVLAICKKMNRSSESLRAESRSPRHSM